MSKFNSIRKYYQVLYFDKILNSKRIREQSDKDIPKELISVVKGLGKDKITKVYFINSGYYIGLLLLLNVVSCCINHAM